MKKQLDSKEFRDAYVDEHVKLRIATQIRALREARGWSQKDLARRANKPQSVISRLEDPDYGRLSLSTLLKLRSVFDVGLVIDFAELTDCVGFYRNFKPSDYAPCAYSERNTHEVVGLYMNAAAYMPNNEASRDNLRVKDVKVSSKINTETRMRLISTLPETSSKLPLPRATVGGTVTLTPVAK